MDRRIKKRKKKKKKKKKKRKPAERIGGGVIEGSDLVCDDTADFWRPPARAPIAMRVAYG